MVAFTIRSFHTFDFPVKISHRSDMLSHSHSLRFPFCFLVHFVFFLFLSWIHHRSHTHTVLYSHIYIYTQSLSLTLIIATFEFNGYDFNKTAENSLSNLDISYSNIEVPFMTHILSPNCFRCHQFGLANHFISQANVPSKWAGRHIPTHTHSYTGRNNVYTFRLSTIVWDQH